MNMALLTEIFVSPPHPLRCVVDAYRVQGALTPEEQAEYQLFVEVDGLVDSDSHGRVRLGRSRPLLETDWPSSSTIKRAEV